MKILAIFFALLFTAAPSSVYDFKLKNIDGKSFDLAKYKGKKILIVNTASQCGFTKQYADLQKLAETYPDKLVVIGFPANNFGGQEPGSAAEIKAFCTGKYSVTFPLNEKVSVKGDDIAPLFKYLTEAENPDFTGEIKWNFEKFLVDEHGKLVHRFRSKTTPMSEEITKYL
ncbi:glutathione peroxidase [Mucilaginibacter myungsuensis]|uniref:Glutathione peroxidase n=1 Tax=Mucilaginibacter myungsuensis TaxID=649104 RepID=A0A929KV70_9SPHI|nr:glutathione peroxidase [Mucilaginibacter myungsuensis]MBE9661033.1 glutathione peroxidase [Mucilaginibacter myungsuensis]MDN3597177.1 glutathione peroxidase [Mucilaginibacter myungsuensis]